VCGSTKNRRSSTPARLLVAALAIIAGCHAAESELPVFLADNHAETFGWIARTFDPDDEHLMVLVDAHTDATAADRSEEIREQLRRVPSLAARDTIVRDWRDSGRLQAFNWIEPLMPRPIGQVKWLAAPTLDEASLAARTKDAVESLDGRLEIEPRSAGALADRWQTWDAGRFGKWQPGNRPVILAIDLDYFAGMPAPAREAAFQAIWKRAMDWPGLAGVAFAVSRPWLTDDAEADALVSLVVAAVGRTPAARLEIDATPDTTPDHSLNAGKGGPIPRWDFAKASPRLKVGLVALQSRLKITDRSRPLVLDEEQPPAILPRTGEIDCDHVWRFAAGQEPVLRMEAPPGSTGKVRWYSLMPARKAYDLMPRTKLGKDFSDAPGRWIHEERHDIGTSADFQLDPSSWRNAAGGRIRITADYETPAGWMPAGTVELRVRTREGFSGTLSECFGMPYVFGIGLQSDGDLSGVETGLGSDCANFLIHAWRRNGLPLTWGDPGRLRSQLTVKAKDVKLGDRPPVSAQEISKGVAIDFGRHVAALWEDREPLGVLDGNDLAAHHLGGFPEILPLAKLAETRPVFSLLVPRTAASCRIAFAGDVVLAGEDRVTVDGFGRGNADLFFANLEGIPSLRDPAEKPRYDFRFPPDRLALLGQAGVDVVSLANNHALDAGVDGLAEGMAALRERDIVFTGAGINAREACQPVMLQRAGVKLAVFGVSLVGGGAAGDGTPGIAMLPDHRDLLAAEFAKARAVGARIIVMLHGGMEYRTTVDEEQRGWARWLSARGAAVIAGAHPHVIQRSEIHGGTTILHSLGNAVYPRRLSGTASGEIRVVEVSAP